jgi:hypothetical protein
MINLAKIMESVRETKTLTTTVEAELDIDALEYIVKSWFEDHVGAGGTFNLQWNLGSQLPSCSVSYHEEVEAPKGVL